MKETIYIDGKFTSSERAKISLFDRGLNYGDGLFETLAAYDGRVFCFDAHLNRMRKGARELSIRSKLLTDISTDGGPVKELLKRNGLNTGTASIKIVVTRGTGGEGHLPGCLRRNPPTIIITAKATNERAIKRYQASGVSAVLVDAPLRMIAHIKSLNFLPSVLAKMEAKKKRAYEAILTNKGKILEASASNIFIVEGNTIKTPPDDGKILPGITRSEILRLAKLDGLKVKEASITKTALLSATEAFLTNSIIEIVPLIKVDSSLLATGKAGPITRRLQKLYMEETIRK
ncbi:MAG: aminotransferase class IV [Thermodesulfobacteriota bacterium]